VAGLARGGRFYPGPCAWWWRSLRRPAAAGAGVGGGGAGEGGRDASAVRCRMGATARCRIARRVDGAQLECKLVLRRAGAVSLRGAPCAEHIARGGDQARRRRRARSAHATGAERVARGGASWHAGAASTR
jgi:hypothetical protein